MPSLKELILTSFAAIVASGVMLWAAWFGYLGKGRELDIQMLHIALGILREDPKKSEIVAARSWAVDVINHHSPNVPIPAEVKEELIKKKLEWVDYGGLDDYVKIGTVKTKRTGQWVDIAIPKKCGFLVEGVDPLHDDGSNSPIEKPTSDPEP